MATPHERIGISRSQVDRAGVVLRDWFDSGLLVDPRIEESSAVVSAFRSQFKGPLKLVVMGLRSAVKTSDAPLLVAERLKRQPRIIGKLQRFRQMELTRMQDIAGCRAILPDRATVDAVRNRVERQKSDVLRVYDYNAAPKPGGYRAIHLVVRRDGALVEIQLRTIWQQRWAMLVEGLDFAYRLQLKDEQGPREVLDYLRAYASSL
ncbi:MAG: RelA/SpoT domain-containing protein, partial [Candidatus Limnocylindrales bacterium]